MPNGSMTALRAIVHGRVQGVGFRYAAQAMARSLGLRGWVRNIEDSRVEVEFEGSGQAVAKFRAWLDHGPPGATVISVAETVIPYKGIYATFTIEY